ncbi:uncharacterized protein LOC106770170 [Vigna radiata var. radiata]|uniref:Uncharacterized protein LOC106770170 n=1 Tax=Vigna radiata var. radiata TaxID=3916 RepID=A0A1S3UZG0_VIGRR|nr:uncharacterized protein LOC106770170 [Vigna radiata var. radiata]
MVKAEPEKQISLKLMVIKKRNKVVFAEAGKDFVDVLFSLFTLPLGTIVRLVREESNMQPIELGSLTSLYQSVENLDKEFLSTDSSKQMILRPKNLMEHYCKSLRLKIDDTEPTEYFVCNNLLKCRSKSPILISMFKNRRCRCGNMLDRRISLGSSYLFDGFVNDSAATFMITDDLRVVPNSLNIFFDLFKNCGIESMSAVNEMTVTITKNQVMDLLKSCLISTITLTSIFLEKPYIEKYRKVEFPPLDVNENDSFKINVKIVQRKSNGKVVFAEGKEDFADFLLSFLTVPLGGVVHLMEGFSCMYKSILNLDQNYWTTNNVKKVVEPGLVSQLLASNKLSPVLGSKYFCYTETKYSSTRNRYLSTYYLTLGNENKCTAADFVDPTLETLGVGNKCTAVDFVDSKGYVKGPTLYMATDDLVVTPMSTTSVISLLTTLRIPFTDLEEKLVSIGIKEGFGILQASLTSKSALTTGLSHLINKVKQEN